MNDILPITNEMAAEQSKNITEIINSYSKRLMGFIKKLVNRQADAEHILQDVFSQLIAAVEPIEQVGGWLFRVARNKIIDQKRKSKPELFSDIFTDEDSEDDGIDWKEFMLDTSSDPETGYLRSLFWDALQEALAELPE